MCYPVPDCDPHKVQPPILAAPTEEDNRGSSYPHEFDRQGPMDQSTLHRPTPNGNLPLFKLPPFDKEEPEYYDYSPTDFPETYPQSLAFPSQSSSSNKVISVSRGSDRPDKTSALQSFGRQSKLELREQYGVHDHPGDKEKVTESPLKEEQSTVRPHMHKDTTTSWQPLQSLTSVQSVTSSDPTTQRDFENPLHALKGLDSVIFPLNQGLGSEKYPEYLHKIPESAVHHQRGTEYTTNRQNASDSVTPKGSTSQINVSDPVRGTDSQTNRQRQSDRLNSSQYMPRSSESPIHPQASSHNLKDLQGTDTPDSEGKVDEEEMVEEKEEIVKFHSVTGPEGGDVPYNTKSAQQERSQEEPESRDPTSSYKMTTPEPSTSFPWGPEFLTTSMVHFITTTQPPERFTPDESEPSRKSGQELFNLHSEDQREVKEEVTEKEEERKDGTVLLIKSDEGKSKDAFTEQTSCFELFFMYFPSEDIDFFFFRA